MMKDIYRKIKESKDIDSLRLATIIDGTNAGQKILLSEAETVCETAEADFLSDNVEYIQKCNNTGIIKIDDVSVFYRQISL